MSSLLRVIARYAARKLAADPEARDKAIGTARRIVEEGRQIAAHHDRAYAAGRAFRRTFEKLRSSRP